MTKNRAIRPLVGILILLIGGWGCTGPKPDPYEPRSLQPILFELDQAVGSDPATAEPPVRERALKTLDDVLEHQPANYPARARKIRWLSAWRRHREVLVETRELERWYSPEPWSVSLKGIALYETGRKEEAVEAFRMVLRSDRRNDAALTGLGIILAESGQDEAAEKYLARAVEIRPANREAAESLELVRLLGREDWKQRLADVSGVDRKKRLARMLFGRGEMELGAEVLIEAYRERREDPEILTGLAYAFSERGLVRRAVSLLGAAASLAPDDPDAWYLQGVICRRLGRREPAFQVRAVRCFETALQLAPQDTELLLACAKAKGDAGDLSGAVESFEDALRIDPANPEVRSDYGLVLARNGDPSGGLRLLSKGRQSNPDHPKRPSNRTARSTLEGMRRDAEKWKSGLLSLGEGMRTNRPEDLRAGLEEVRPEWRGRLGSLEEVRARVREENPRFAGNVRTVHQGLTVLLYREADRLGRLLAAWNDSGLDPLSKQFLSEGSSLSQEGMDEADGIRMKGEMLLRILTRMSEDPHPVVARWADAYRQGVSSVSKPASRDSAGGADEKRFFELYEISLLPEARIRKGLEADGVDPETAAAQAKWLTRFRQEGVSGAFSLFLSDPEVRKLSEVADRLAGRVLVEVTVPGFDPETDPGNPVRVWLEDGSGSRRPLQLRDGVFLGRLSPSEGSDRPVVVGGEWGGDRFVQTVRSVPPAPGTLRIELRPVFRPREGMSSGSDPLPEPDVLLQEYREAEFGFVR